VTRKHVLAVCGSDGVRIIDPASHTVVGILNRHAVTSPAVTRVAPCPLPGYQHVFALGLQRGITLVCAFLPETGSSLPHPSCAVIAELYGHGPMPAAVEARVCSTECPAGDITDEANESDCAGTGAVFAVAWDLGPSAESCHLLTGGDDVDCLVFLLDLPALTAAAREGATAGRKPPALIPHSRIRGAAYSLPGRTKTEKLASRRRRLVLEGDDVLRSFSDVDFLYPFPPGVAPGLPAGQRLLLYRSALRGVSLAAVDDWAAGGIPAVRRLASLAHSAGAVAYVGQAPSSRSFPPSLRARYPYDIGGVPARSIPAVPDADGLPGAYHPNSGEISIGAAVAWPWFVAGTATGQAAFFYLPAVAASCCAIANGAAATPAPPSDALPGMYPCAFVSVPPDAYASGFCSVVRSVSLDESQTTLVVTFSGGTIAVYRARPSPVP
jgi:hypothetical protein